MAVYGSNVSSVLGLERVNRRPFLIKRPRPWVPSNPQDDSSPTWNAKAHFGWYLFLSTSRSTFLLSFEWNLIWGPHMSGVPVRFTETVVFYRFSDKTSSFHMVKQSILYWHVSMTPKYLENTHQNSLNGFGHSLWGETQPSHIIFSSLRL